MQLRDLYQADCVIVNGENAAGGLGIDAKTADELRNAGADVITLGDHAWQKKDALSLLEAQKSWIIRPANFPAGAPGSGWTIFKTKAGESVAVINLLGRVFMNALVDCPFHTAKQILADHLQDCKVIVCDIHAEATSEKQAMARYLGGQVSLVFGTHTHVQTADELVYPNGTAFISDLGMCGSLDGVIGMEAERAISRFLTGLPHSYEAASGPATLQGVCCEVDSQTGKAIKIERVRYVEDK